MEDPTAHRSVEGGNGLVEYDEIWSWGERPRDGYALSLTA